MERYLTREPITVPTLPVHSRTAQTRAPEGKDPKTAILSRFQALQAEGLSPQAMAHRFKNEGAPTLSGKGRWQKGIIGNLLAQIRN
jgi:hypothetical protein